MPLPPLALLCVLIAFHRRTFLQNLGVGAGLPFTPSSPRPPTLANR